MAQPKQSNINWEACSAFMLEQALLLEQRLPELLKQHPALDADLWTDSYPPSIYVTVWVPMRRPTNRKRTSLSRGENKLIPDVMAVMTDEEIADASALVAELAGDLRAKRAYPQEETHCQVYLIKPDYGRFTYAALERAARQKENLADGVALFMLREHTYAIEHNPNCPKPYLVRLVGAPGMLDGKPVRETEDHLGYGTTLKEAAVEALRNKAEWKNARVPIQKVAEAAK